MPRIKQLTRFFAKRVATAIQQSLSYLQRKKFADQDFWLRVHVTALNARGFGRGDDLIDGGESGGAEFLKTLLSDAPTIVDVGANRGQFAQLILRHFPKAILHCLEPQEDCHRDLAELFDDSKNVHVHPIALSDRNGAAAFFADKAGSTLGSLFERRLDHFKIEMPVQQEINTTTLDDFCRQNKIEQIDLLKLDIEGAEFLVLQQCSDCLSTRVKAVQFEFGGANIDSKTYWQDFFYLLSSEYTLYRLSPSQVVEVSNYKEVDEVFITTNYLAIRKKEAADN